MKKILLYTLFLSFISVLQAQITPDGTTITTTSDAGSGIIRIDIAAPDNGLSNNNYSDFDISSSGVILNNSASASASQLTGGNISGNSNISTGSEAILILNQVTSNNDSLLEGITEVVGTNAAVIIANPFGITCNGCGFINASRVDLVVGTANLGSGLIFFASPGDELTINGSGLDASGSDLNLVSNRHSILAPVQAGTNLRVLSGNYIYDPVNFTFTSSGSFSSGAAVRLSGTGHLQAGSILIVGTENGVNGLDLVADYPYNSFVSSVGGIEINIAGNIDFAGNITSATDLTIDADSFEHRNGTTIADTFNLFVADDFDYLNDYLNNGTISNDALNLQVGGDFRYDNTGAYFTWSANNSLVVLGNAFFTTANFSNSGEIDVANNLNVTVTTENFINYGEIYVANKFNAEITEFAFFNWYSATIGANATISADSFIIEAQGFLNDGSGGGAIINANNFNVTAAVEFNNRNGATINTSSSIITAGRLVKTADSTINANDLTVSTDSFKNTDDTGNGTINADTFNLSINNDFDYVTGYRSNGTINVGTLNLNVAGNFSYDNVNNFIWEASDSLTVAGNANIDARTGVYTQKGGTLDVAGALTVSARNIDLQNVSTINVGGTLSVSATNSFTPRSGATISVDTFDFSTSILQNQATFTANDGTIDISGGGESRQFYNYDGEFNINNSLNIITAGAFSNYGDISAGDTLTITMTDATKNFVNHLSSLTGNISTNIFNLSVAGNFDYEDDYLNNGTISNDALNLNVGGNFSYDDSASDFIWDANNSLVVLGNADITVNNYTQNGAIDVTGTLTITTGLNFINENTATISADTFDFTVGGILFSNPATIIANNGRINLTNISGNFYNTGEINVTNNFDITTDKLTNSRNIIVGDTLTVTLNSDSLITGFINVNDSNYEGIVADTFNLSVADDFDYLNDYLNNGTISNDALNLQVGGDFSYDDSASDFTWGANDSLTVLGNADITVNNYNQSGIVDVAGTLTITTELDFTNENTATISVASFNVTAGDDFLNDGTITARRCNISFVGTYTNNGTFPCFETLVIDIAAPDANGLSNNSYPEFDISTSGLVLNNSYSDATSQLAGLISANSNYSTGDIATLILAQVTGSNMSLLNGTLEVFGTEAGLIIANPNGIDCDGCGFINASKVDLVTGTSNFSGTDLTGFSINNVAEINVNGDGFVDDTVADELNLVSRDLRIQAQVKANNTLRVIAGDGTYDHISNIITSDDTEVSAHSIQINASGSLEANYIELISTELSSSGTYGIVNEGGNISADTLRINSNGLFRNQDGGNILATNLNITTTKFTNTSGNITADTFDLSVSGDFDYTNRGTITTNALNLNVAGDLTNNDGASDFTWGANNSLVVLGNADITADNYTQSGVIDVTGAWSINANNYTYNNPSNDFTWGANDSLVVLGNADITTDNYTQSGVIDVTGTLAISAIGDFTNSTGGDISTGSLGLTVGNLIQNDGAIDTDILTIDTDTIHNPGNIIANTSLTITATNNVFSGGSIITNALDIDANRNFANHGDITADSLNITADNTALNTGTIVSGSLDIITADFFRNLTGGDISVDSLNITAGGKVTNIATITAATLNITANNDSSRTDTTGFYVANRGDIQATNFNIAAEDNFYNRGNITANTFNITKAKDIFFFNEEIQSFDDGVNTYNGGDIYLTGNSSFRADGRIENYGNIDLGDNNLAITAFIFINHADATIDTAAATLNLNVNTFIDDGSITATIIQ